MVWIVLVVFTQMTAIYAVRPLISYRALEIGATTGQIGFIAAAYAAFSFGLAVPVGRRVDRTAEVPFILVGSAVVTASILIVPANASIVWLGIAQAMLGVGQLLGIMGIQALVANAGEPAGRDGRFGVFTATASVGQMAGPSLAGWLAADGGASNGTVYFVVGLMGAVSLGCAVPLRLRPPRRDEGLAHRGAKDSERPGLVPMLMFPGMRTAMWASLTVLASIDVLIAYLPVYGVRYGIPVTTIGLLLATRAAGSTVVRLGMVPLTRLAGAGRLLTASLAVTAVSLALLPALASAPVWTLYVTLALAGMGLGLGQPLTMSWVATRAPATQRATALGLRITGNRVGQLVIPAAVGLVAGSAGVSAVLVALGALLASSSLCVARLPIDNAA